MPSRLLIAVMAVVTGFVLTASAAWAGCGGKLGVSRTLPISAKRHSSIHGYEKRLGLRDKEIILTFDDGPLSNTSKVLKALGDECVRATFFVVGRHVSRTPSKVRAMKKRGHTIAHHTWNHENLARLNKKDMGRAIDKGIRSVNKALYGSNSSRARNPMFRYPYLAKSKSTRAAIRARGLVEVGTNIDTGDWKRQSSSQLHDRIMKQLKKKRRGIVLMHDIQPRTAKMLPRLLRSMKKAGFRIVHMVPAGSAEPKAVEVASLEPEKKTRGKRAGRAAKRSPKKDVIEVSAKRSGKAVRKASSSKLRKSKTSLKRAVSKSKKRSQRRTAKTTSRTTRARRVARTNLRARFIIQ